MCLESPESTLRKINDGGFAILTMPDKSSNHQGKLLSENEFCHVCAVCMYVLLQGVGGHFLILRLKAYKG